MNRKNVKSLKEARRALRKGGVEIGHHEPAQRGKKGYKVLKGRKEAGLTKAEAWYCINLAEEDKIQK